MFWALGLRFKDYLEPEWHAYCDTCEPKENPTEEEIKQMHEFENDPKNTIRFELNDEQYDFIVRCIKECQDELNGVPPNWHQVRQKFTPMADMNRLGISVGKFTIRCAVYWRDKVFFDKECLHCSLTRYNADFMTHKERFESKFKDQGYYLDSVNRIRAGETTPTVNYEKLIQIMKSRDENLL